MNSVFRRSNWLLIWAILGVTAGTAAAAQDAPPAPGKSTAQIDAGEPRANTSAPAAAPAAAPESPTAPVTAPVAPQPQAAANAAPRAAGTRPSKAPGRTAPGASDRLDLSTATVTGDREQPKVMYIVPWKRSDIGDLSGKPMNSLLDEALAPVDRDEFRREVAYYDAVKSTSSQNGTPQPAANQGEK
jgi:hypothetical protein